MAKILLVEDEPELSDIVRNWLINEKYVVDQVFDGSEALLKLGAGDYDLVILDLMLPSLSGFEVCRNYRQRGGERPIIMLTAKRALATKEAGLDAGADDYLTKPFKLRELSARIRALLRRAPRMIEDSLRFGDVEVDLIRRQVLVDGKAVHLLPKEFSLLETLLKGRGTTVSPERLLKGLWSDDSSVSSDTIRSHVRSLRKKLGSSGALVENIYGIGYRINA